MRSQPISKSANFRFSADTVHDGTDTSFLIFNKQCLHLYEIDYSHFKAMNGILNQPIVGRYSEREMDNLTREMVPTASCIWDMVKQFLDGAHIRIPCPKTAALIYKTIAAHVEAHLTAMRTIKMYEAPDPEDFRALTEFAVGIRLNAMRSDDDIDGKRAQGINRQQLPVRASFSRQTVQEDAEKKPDIPRVMQKMDCIDRYLESINGR